MTKTISLADDAYEALSALKGRGESFSDLARRLAKQERRRSLRQFAGAWADMEADTDALIDAVYRRRAEGDRGRPTWEGA